MVDDRSFRRWAEEGSEVGEPIRRLMEAAAAEGPPPGAHARLEHRLAPLLGGSPGTTPDTEPPPPVPTGSTPTTPPAGALAVTGLVAAAVAAGVAATLMLGGGDPRRALHVAPKPAPTQPEPAAVAPKPAPTHPEPAAVAEPAELEPSPMELPPAESAEPEAHPEAPPALRSASPVRARPRRSHRRPSASPEVSSQPSTLVEEARLLARAQSALATAPAEALSLTADHARRFHPGALAEEREAIAIEALVRLGRGGDARSRADRFFVRHPRSTYRTRIEAVLAGERRAP